MGKAKGWNATSVVLVTDRYNREWVCCSWLYFSTLSAGAVFCFAFQTPCTQFYLLCSVFFPCNVQSFQTVWKLVCRQGGRREYVIKTSSTCPYHLGMHLGQRKMTLFRCFFNVQLTFSHTWILHRSSLKVLLQNNGWESFEAFIYLHASGNRNVHFQDHVVPP